MAVCFFLGVGLLATGSIGIGLAMKAERGCSLDDLAALRRKRNVQRVMRSRNRERNREKYNRYMRRYMVEYRQRHREEYLAYQRQYRAHKRKAATSS